MREDQMTTTKPLLKHLQIRAVPHLQDFNLSVALPVLSNRVKVQKFAKVCQFQIIGSHNVTALEGVTIAHEPTGAVAVAVAAALPPSNQSDVVECAS